MKQNVTQPTTEQDDGFTTLSIRRSAKAKYDLAAARLRLDLFEVAGIAIEALNNLPREKQEKLIDVIKPVESAPAS